MARILVVEDDTQVAVVVQEALESNNHVVDWVADGSDGLERISHYPYDLAIVDWNLPGLTGLEILKTYRESGGKMPILFLTGQSDVPNRVEALNLGADDYLIKPFAYAELMARIRALLRRPQQVQQKVIEAREISLDLNTCSVTRCGESVSLAPSEFALLELFMKNPGRLFSSKELLDRVFTLDSDATDEAVRQRILRLRKKIDVDGKESLIKTVKGLGYKLEMDP